MTPTPGDVWQVDFGYAAKIRPVIIVSRYDPDAPRAIATCVPVTTQNRGTKYEVELPRTHFLREGSAANAQALTSVEHKQLDRRLGTLPPEVFEKVKRAVAFALDLETVPAMLDENQNALKQVEKATDSEPVSGEGLLQSEDLKRQLREAKERPQDPQTPT